MSKWVRLEYNTVVEIVPSAATIPSIEAWFGRQFAEQCVCVSDEVQPNWLYDPETGMFSDPECFTEHAPEAPPVPNPQEET